MMRSLLQVLLATFFLGRSLCGDLPDSVPEQVPISSLTVEARDRSLGDYLTVDKVIALETTDQALISEIRHMEIDPSNGDLIVGDYYGSRKIWRFNPAGKLRFTYGSKGQGPGEYSGHISSATLLPDSSLVIFADYKIIKYDPEGKFVMEQAVNFTPDGALAAGDSLYITPLTGREKPTHGVLIYDAELNPMAKIIASPAKYPLLSIVRINSIAATNQGWIAYIETLRMELVLFHPGKGKVKIFTFDDNNELFEKYTKGAAYPHNSMRTLGPKLHWFYSVWAVGSQFLLHEILTNDRVQRYHLFDPQTHRMISLRNASTRELAREELPFTAIVGTQENQLIGYIDDPDASTEKELRLKGYDGAGYKFNGNPLIVFATFNLENRP